MVSNAFFRCSQGGLRRWKETELRDMENSRKLESKEHVCIPRVEGYVSLGPPDAKTELNMEQFYWGQMLCKKRGSQM